MMKASRAVLLAGALLVHPITATVSHAEDAVESTSLIADTVERVAPMVVNIVAETQVTRSYARSPLEQFFYGNGPNNVVPRHGEGSGFVMDEKGLILTNDHVVSGATSITVNMANGRKYKAHLKASDPSHDIAVLQLDDIKPPLTAAQVAKLGDSDKVRVGEWVIAIGSPFSLQKTVTKGIISALGRNLTIGQRQYLNLIQTDALINPGNSGGPLLNMKGEVIGVNSAINPNGQGIGFAIPINRAKVIANELISSGRYRGTWLGVNIEPVTEELAQRFGMGDQAGVVVRSAVHGGPAAKAGVLAGDLITHVNARPVTNPIDLKVQVEGTPAGQKAKLTVVRDGKPQDIDVTVEVMGKVDELADDQPAAAKATPRETAEGGLSFFGVEARDLGPQDRQEQELPPAITAGAVITQVGVGSKAEALGLEAGDVIFWLNRGQVGGASALDRALSAVAKGRGELLIKVWRRGSMLLLQASF